MYLCALKASLFYRVSSRPDRATLKSPVLKNQANICTWSHGSLHVYSLVGSLVPGSSGGVWLVHIVVLPMGLQTPTAPSVLFLTHLLGTPFSVQWWAASICVCICQASMGVEALGTMKAQCTDVGGC